MPKNSYDSMSIKDLLKDPAVYSGYPVSDADTIAYDTSAYDDDCDDDRIDRTYRRLHNRGLTVTPSVAFDNGFIPKIRPVAAPPVEKTSVTVVFKECYGIADVIIKAALDREPTEDDPARIIDIRYVMAFGDPVEIPFDRIRCRGMIRSYSDCYSYVYDKVMEDPDYEETLARLMLTNIRIAINETKTPDFQNAILKYAQSKIDDAPWRFYTMSKEQSIAYKHDTEHYDNQCYTVPDPNAFYYAPRYSFKVVTSSYHSALLGIGICSDKYGMVWYRRFPEPFVHPVLCRIWSEEVFIAHLSDYLASKVKSYRDGPVMLEASCIAGCWKDHESQMNRRKAK